MNYIFLKYNEAIRSYFNHLLYNDLGIPSKCIYINKANDTVNFKSHRYLNMHSNPTHPFCIHIRQHLNPYSYLMSYIDQYRTWNLNKIYGQRL